MQNDAFQLACKAHGLGQIDKAEQLFRLVPLGSPDYPDSVMALAVIAYQRGHFQVAVQNFSRLAALRPGDAATHANLGECLRECGRLDEALAHLNIGIDLDPNQPDAHNSLGLIYHARHQIEKSEASIREAIRLRPEFPMAMINLGMVLQEKRGLKEAAGLFRAALELDPQNPMGLSNLGQILLELGQLDDLEEARKCCLKAIQITPDRPHPVNNLGNVYRAMGKFEEAVECYEKALALAPGLPMPLNNMAQALQGRGRYDEATEYYLRAIAMEPLACRFHANYASLLSDQNEHEKAIERYQYVLSIDPQHAESHTGMGQAYMQMQETALAEAAFKKALEIDSELSAPRMGLGNLYAELGEFEKADAQYAEVLKEHPKCVEVYYQRATHQKGKVAADDVDRMISLAGEKYLGDGGRSQLHFGLGAVYDNRKEFQLAAEHLKLANELQRSAKLKKNETYDPENFTQWIDQMIQAFTPELVKLLKGAGSESKRPIFVVGLPRSGTTLTEQILASHSAVFGAGELTSVSDVFEKVRKSRGDVPVNPVEVAGFLDGGLLKQSADELLRYFDKKDDQHARIVDKMPDNINLMGWIRLLFPNAKVIHCRRDLRDIALSCYQTCFGSIRWANDWNHIARRFLDYQRVVKHWESIPEIEWLDFEYENVVEEPEKNARRLMEFVGLDWEPGCLNFHETKRQVRTASLSQVREPIYKSSKAKWRNYESLMRPFLDQMGSDSTFAE